MIHRGTLLLLGLLLGCHEAPPAPGEAAPSPAELRYGRPPAWSTEPVPPAPTASQDLVDLGERLYGWNCFPCHGAEGKGDGPVAQRQGLHPRDFTRGLFMLKSSAPGEMPFDEDLYRTIAVGVPLGGMPRNPNLELRDRWALVAYVKSLSAPHFQTKAPGRPWSAPAPREAPDPERGKTLFRVAVNCAACHGAGGKGDGPAAPELRDAWERPAPPPDLTRGDLGLKAGSRLEDIFRTLTLGMAGTPMPSFAPLPENDRWDLAAYVRSLFEPISPGEKVFLGAGCLACHTVGKGKLVGPDLVDVRERRDRAWLRRWLADPPDMLSRDPAVRKEFQDYKVQMPKLDLNAPEIEALIGYLESLRPASRWK